MSNKSFLTLFGALNGSASKVTGTNFDRIRSNIDHLTFGKNAPQMSLSQKKNILENLTNTQRKKIKQYVNKNYSVSNFDKYYQFLSPEIEGINRTAINVTDCLKGNESTKFDVDLLINKDYNVSGEQFIKIRFKKPELDPSAVIPQGNYQVRFWYTNKPGIRSLEEIMAKSNTNSYDYFNRDAALFFHSQNTLYNMREKFDRLIGEDNGVEGSVYIQMSEVYEVRKIKTGFQTPKANPDNLDFYIPLIFNSSRDFNHRINSINFSKNTLSYTGKFAPSDELVFAAAFNLDDPLETPIPLKVKPLKFEICELISFISASNDLCYLLDINSSSNLFSDFYGSRSKILSEAEADIDIGRIGEVTQIAFAVRPANYRNSKDWDKFTQYDCYTSPIPVPVLDNGNIIISIDNLRSNIPVEVLDQIGIFYDGDKIFYNGENQNNENASFYSVLDPYVKSKRCFEYDPAEGLYHFNINPYVSNERIAMIYNFNALEKSMLRYRFKKDNPNISSNGDLIEKYELVMFYHKISAQNVSGNNISDFVLNNY